MQNFHVRLSSDELVFSTSHFITLGAEQCERLHGHNYRVAAEVHGQLDENHCVVDFIALRNMLRKIVGELDHRVLLPTDHPAIRVAAGDLEVEVAFAERRWVFPRSDCLLMPIPNTTTELLAQHIGRLLLVAVQSATDVRPDMVRIELEESPGLSAVCELRGE